MRHLQNIAEGFGPSEEHIRVLEAYFNPDWAVDA